MGIGNSLLQLSFCAILLLQVGLLDNKWAVSVPEFKTDVFDIRTFTEHVRPAVPLKEVLLADSAIRNADSAVFVGDVLLARNVEVLMKRYGTAYPLQYFSPQDFAPNPIVIGNFEATIPATHVPTPTGQIQFSVSSSTLPALLERDFALMSLANNHSLDFGDEGLEHTKVALQSVGIKSFGSGNGVDAASIQTFRINNRSVAVIGINALSSVESSSLRDVFTKATRMSDFQIVYVHWGEEYALAQNATQRSLAKDYITLGADMVIGHHPHVTQGIEVIDDVFVFYSLGNLLFDQYFSQDVQEGLALTLQLAPSPRVVLEPYTSRHALSQPRPMVLHERLEFLAGIAERSDTGLYQSIIQGELQLPDSFATSPKMAIINQ